MGQASSTVGVDGLAFSPRTSLALQKMSLWEIQEKTRFALGELEPMYLMYNLAYESEVKGSADSKPNVEEQGNKGQSESENRVPDEEFGIQKATFIKKYRYAFGGLDDWSMGRIFDALISTQDNYFSPKSRLSFESLAWGLSVNLRGTQEEVLQLLFNMYDVDHDGLMKREELESLVQHHERQAGEAYGHGLWKVPLDSIVQDAFQNIGPDEGISLEQFIEAMDRQNAAPVLSHPDLGRRRANASETYLPDLEGSQNVGNPAKPDAHSKTFRSAQLTLAVANSLEEKAFHELPDAGMEGLSSLERETLVLIGEEVLVDNQDVLRKEGEEGRSRNFSFYFIIEGEVEISRDGILIETQGPGTFFGESALFQDFGDPNFLTTIRTSARAVYECRLLRIRATVFYIMVLNEHEGAAAILQRLGQVMVRRIERLEEQVESLLEESIGSGPALKGLRLSKDQWKNYRKKLLAEWSLRYHRCGRKGKLEVVASKSVGTKQDLSIAYSPGVADPCLAIKKNESQVYEFTGKGHLVGVITNGTAVLGLGDIGPHAAKPVMEGKAVLFKKFADLDSYDIEINEKDPDKLISMIVSMEPTFGGINLEDIKSPECFRIEKECQAKMNIPVFHDDQHGTAIVAGAGLVNALELIKKKIQDIKVVVCGCGAAGFTCAKYFVSMGVKKENLIAVDVSGVVYQGRADLTEDNYLCEVAVDTKSRTLSEAVNGADVFLGLSVGNILTPDMLRTMKKDPIVFALANPTPEIDPLVAKKVRKDVIIATGRSDFPNQVNNVCAFPYIMRGALDCRATKINEEMKRAATEAIRLIARDNPAFGRSYIIPQPDDPNLLVEVSYAVAKAAMNMNIARVIPTKYKLRLHDLSAKGSYVGPNQTTQLQHSTHKNLQMLDLDQ